MKPGRGNKTPPPRETEKGLIPRADRRARTCSLAEPVVLTRHASAPRAVRSLAGSATLDKPLIRECLFYPTYEPLAMLLGSGLCVARTPRLPRIQTLHRNNNREFSVQLKSKTRLLSLSRKIDTPCLEFIRPAYFR